MLFFGETVVNQTNLNLPMGPSLAPDWVLLHDRTWLSTVIQSNMISNTCNYVTFSHEPLLLNNLNLTSSQTNTTSPIQTEIHSIKPLLSSALRSFFSIQFTVRSIILLPKKALIALSDSVKNIKRSTSLSQC